jgi:diazepam-binding inhibitor (GABA receptor modulating acyl-CoA-binding protein)
MATSDDFGIAQKKIRQLRREPSNEDLLDLYGLYKQATFGDVQGSRPGMMDIKGLFKYDAWAKRKGTPKEGAMLAYVELVAQLLAKDGQSKG